MPQALLFDFNTKIITVPAPDTSLELQFLLNSIRYAEETLNPGIQYSKIADAFGKQDLGGGVQVGITVVLLDGWRVAFEARSGPNTISVTISGGNFVGEAGANPVAPTAFTQVTIAQSTSATISTPTTDTNLVYLVESLRNIHPALGSIYYWDPYGGNDTNNGSTPALSVKTFAQAQILANSGNNDLIFCRPTDPSGTSTITESINVTKHNLKIRGPGNYARFMPTNDAIPTVSITADNVELSGFYLETAATGGQDCITVSGNNLLLRDLWVNNVQGTGITITSAARMRILTSAVEHCGQSGTGNGIHLGNTTSQSLISKCIINDSVKGIELAGTGISDNVIENCLVYKNTTYGVTIGAGVARTTLRGGNTITNNTIGNTLDNGTDTYIETQAGGASTTDIADAVWNEVIADHAGAGSAGKTLKDAKTKATLASLK